MIIRQTIGSWLVTVLLLFFFNDATAQRALKPMQETPVGKEILLYRITQEQASYLIDHTITFRDTAYFRSFVSLVKDDDDIYNLPYGHYLKVSASGPVLKYDYIPVSPFILYLPDNSTDFLLLVKDKKNGVVLNDLQVTLDGNVVPFDKAGHTYRLKQSRLKGTLDIAMGSAHYYYRIENSPVSGKRRTGPLRFRAVRGVVYTAYNFVRLPVDGFNSIRKGYAVGSIYRVKYGSVRRWNNFARLFKKKNLKKDRTQYVYNNDNYTFFSKPKYRPDDTVSFKTLLLNRQSRTWCSEPLTARLRNQNETYYLGTCTPQHGSGYDYRFTLHDSMKLQVDQQYTIELIDKDSVLYGYCSFPLEHYELQKAVFTIDCQQTEHIKGKPFEIRYTAKDENGLPMRDTKAEVIVTAQRISSIRPDHLFVPFEVWKQDYDIEDGFRNVTIPDSIFADADYSYTLKTALHNAEQERKESTISLNYLQEKSEIKAELTGDSITIRALQNNVPVQIPATLKVMDRYGYYLSDKPVTLPYTEKINTHAGIYRVQTALLHQDISMSDFSGMIRCNANRTGDSVFTGIENPRRLPFTYQIYQRNKELWRSYATALDTAFAANEKDLYYVAIQYVWAGRVVSDMYQIALHDKLVNLLVEQPQVVYPGKETEITITATDYKGRPVEHLSILSYAYTGRFGNTATPTLPDFSSKQRQKYVVNHFSETSDFKGNYAINLNYDYWRKHMSIDTMPGFRFLFPDEDIEKTEIPAEDSITQFAPFVTDSGRLQGVHYVLVNSVPVYFGFTHNKTQYSFEPGSSTYSQVRIRTAKNLIIIDSLEVKPFYKTLFTVDLHRKMNHVTVVPMPDKLTTDEINNYSAYIIGLNEYNTQSAFRYLGSSYRKSVFPLVGNASGGYYYNNYNRYSKNSLGPIYNANWSYKIPGQYAIEFEVERGYTYSFKPQTVKMVLDDRNEQLIDSNAACNVPLVGDWIITEKKMLELYHQKPRQMRRTINYASDYNGSAQLQIELEQLAKDSLGFDIQPLNIILSQPGNFNFINIYPGNTRFFPNLPAGTYDIMIIEENGIFRSVAGIGVQDQGINFYRIRHTDTMRSEKMRRLDSFINTLYYTPYANHEKDAQLIMGKFIDATYTGPFSAISGTVLDNTAEGIPGASITIQSTRIGTVTDVDGRFRIEVPLSLAQQKMKITISAMGYDSEEWEAADGKIYKLRPSKAQINEVVVYGQKIDKRSYTGSVSTITSRDIAKRPVSDISTALEGAAPGVAVTSGGGQPGASPDIQIRGQHALSAVGSPLIVLDGVPYSGSLASINPAWMQDMTVLKDAAATSIYGSRGANGVIIITTKKGAALPDAIKKAMEEATPIIPEDIMVSGLRSHFSDDAFWQPNLITDKNGKVSFKVKFPDDLTSWSTFVYATNDKMQTGQASGSIRSFKPVSAALQGTTFLVEGDSANFIGKSVSYISDTLSISNAFYINDSLQKETTLKLAKYNNEIIPVTASKADSVKLKYLLRKDDGYFDGEEKTIDIMPRGVSVAKGAFLSLSAKDTTIIIPPAAHSGPLYLNATASLIDIVIDEIEKVKHYKHLCNEQLSSKIIATLNQQKIYEALKRPLPPNHKKDVQQMVNLLLQRQNNSLLWGWWGDGYSVIWISQHVIRALNFARDMHYNIGQINFERIVQPIVYQWESDTTLTDIASLKLLQTANMKIDYEKYIKRIERRKNLTMGQKLDLIRFRQELKLPYSTRLLSTFKQEDIYGNIYWKDTVNYIYENDVLNTLTAFKILQRDSTVAIDKNKVVNWLLQERKVDGWRNIYESSQLIEAIASGIDLNDTASLKPVLNIRGGLTDTVTSFPYQQQLNVHETISIHKTGAAPVYLTWYQRHWDTANNDLGQNFILRSAFEYQSKETDKLRAGQAVQLRVKVNVVKNADFVMIDIPVPAGCSFAGKSKSYRYNEVHREYYKDRVSIFCEKMPKGEYWYTVELLPRFTGRYTLNPAKAELMYFPVFYGREKIKQVAIE